jgi:hypothetical protein
MIAGLSTCDEQFPALLRDRIVLQAQDSLNMLRTSRAHSQVSAYHVLEGAHDFNRVPWAPPGTPETRTSWGGGAPLMPGISGLPQNTIGATISISRQRAGPEHPAKQPSTRNTAVSPKRPQWM